MTSKSTTPPLVRQWLVLQALSPKRRGATVNELAEELEVNAKTIRRDLQTFLAAGFPLVEERGPHGRKTWRLSPDWKSADVHFNFEEALALYMGRRFLEPLAGTFFWNATQSAFLKIRRMIGPAALDYVEQVSRCIHHTSPGESDYREKGELIDRLMQAIEDQKVAFITYRSLRSTEPTTYDVHPYGLTFHRQSLYLVGFSPQHQEVRTWKIDRLLNAEVDSMPFVRPADFDITQHFAQSFGVWSGDGELRVAVRFAPSAARYVQEKQWHASQRLTDQSDGGLLAEFCLSSTTEIKSWILSFGASAEVLEPDSLREEIREEIRRLQRSYDATPCHKPN